MCAKLEAKLEVQIHTHICTQRHLVGGGDKITCPRFFAVGIATQYQVDLEVAKVDVSYIDSFVETHGFMAWYGATNDWCSGLLVVGENSLNSLCSPSKTCPSNFLDRVQNGKPCLRPAAQVFPSRRRGWRRMLTSNVCLGNTTA